jgi:ABC-2 type transport system ATP-binding protein
MTALVPSPAQLGSDHQPPAIEVRGLHRTYGRGASAYHAVRGVDLDVPHGQVTALLGTNGAGKTSTLEVIEGLASPSDGTVRVLGHDPVADAAKVRPRLGVLLQRSGFPGDLTVREVLRMWAGTLTAPRSIEESLEMVALEAKADTRVLSLSGGEQRRLDVACTLMGDPEVVVLDEPTTGMDVERRNDVLQLVKQLRDRGRAVLFSTHHLDEVEELADQVAVMHRGRIARRGTLADVIEGHPSTISFATPYDASGRALDLPALAGEVTQRAERGGVTTVRTRDVQRALHRLLTWADADDVRLDQLRAETASLESVFLSIAGKSHDDETTEETR